MLDTSQYHAALMHRLRTLDDRMHAIEAELDTPRSSDWEESAVEREGDEVLESLGHNSELEVARIRAALARIRDGSYGTCTVCGEPISEERLEVLPETPMCRVCAAQTS
ncbi:TraR/DksA family transcriptional regulator [Roseovarius sp. D22-M7]|uniref:TraR/DksA family transcriptional regulator n=1 Tax=Roseovarius sp. D22-M7 TaxID=3127116 RepID=UPI00300FC149